MGKSLSRIFRERRDLFSPGPVSRGEAAANGWEDRAVLSP